MRTRRPRPGPTNDADNGSLWLLRRLVLAEVAIAIVVLALTALLGIATPPTPSSATSTSRPPSTWLLPSR